MSARFSGRRAAGVAAASYATLTLVPWVIDTTRTPRAGLLLGAVPLALVFGALAGYATAPLGLTTDAVDPATTPLHTRTGPHLVLVPPAPPDPSPGPPAAHLHLVPDPPTGPAPRAGRHETP